MEILSQIWKLIRKVLTNKVIGVFIFVGLIILTAKLCQIHDKDVDPNFYINGLPNIMGLFNTEYFMGLVFIATMGVYVLIAAILWHYHEIPLHKVQKTSPAFVDVVFGLALCGLIFHKAWFVIAMFIAFTPWGHIGRGLSNVIRRGLDKEILSLEEPDKNSNTTSGSKH